MSSHGDIVYHDMFEELTEYECGDVIHIIDYTLHNTRSSNNPWIRVNYWVIPGEIRSYDIGLSKYKSNIRDRKLRKIGI